MDLRIELFVADLDRSIRFYELALGFTLERREQDYASMRRGQAVLGLAVVTKLPPDGPGPGFTQTRVANERGAGVEIVLEVEDLDEAYAGFERAGERVAEPIRTQPWGLRDFRLVDPDGYYLRVTTKH
jgi:lactoylglutathione lyase